MNRLFLMFVAVAALAVTTQAQKIGAAKPAVPSVKAPKVAIMPLMFWEKDGGSDAEYTNSAREPYEKALYGTFEKLGMEKLGPIVNFTWKEMKGSTFSTVAFQMPEPADLVALGKKLGADYVVVSRCHWLVRSPWVTFGPKTKAHATVDLWIVDVANSEFALKAEQVKSDSTEKAPDWKLAVDLFLAPISAFSGGPKTGHEMKSGLLSLGKAIQPWLEKQQTTGKIKGAL